MKRKSVLVLLLAALLISTFAAFIGCTDENKEEVRYFLFDSVEMISLPSELENSYSVDEYEELLATSYEQMEYMLIVYSDRIIHCLNNGQSNEVPIKVVGNEIVSPTDEEVVLGMMQENRLVWNLTQYVEGKIIVFGKIIFKETDPPEKPIIEDETNDSDSYWDQPITEVEGKVFEVDSFELHDEEGMTIEEIIEDEKRFVYQDFNGMEFHFKNGKLSIIYGEGEPNDRNTVDYEIKGNWIYVDGENSLEIQGNRLVYDSDDWSTYVFFREKGAPIANDVRGNTYAYQSVTIIPDSPQDEAIILGSYPSLEAFSQTYAHVFANSSISFHNDGSADALIEGQLYSWSSYFQPDKYVVGYCENGSYGDDYIARKEGDTLIFENRFIVRFGDEEASVSWKMIMTKQ